MNMPIKSFNLLTFNTGGAVFRNGLLSGIIPLLIAWEGWWKTPNYDSYIYSLCLCQFPLPSILIKLITL